MSRRGRRLGRSQLIPLHVEPAMATAAIALPRSDADEIDSDFPRIAEVFENRLHRNIPLGSDATLYYVKPLNYGLLTASDLRLDSPYNTRLHTGLPPTPIGNPGLASLRAAAHPAHVSYLFFVRKPGKSGAHAFSSSDAQFEKDVARYQRSRGK